MKPKNPDRLIRIDILVTECQKEHLENLGKQQASVYIRKLIGAQMSGHEVELSKLKEEARQHEAELNIIKAQISELEAVDQRKEVAGKTRELLLEQAAGRIISGLQYLELNKPEINQMFKNNIVGINRTLGSNGEPVTAEELIEITIKKAEAKGVPTYE